MQNSKNCKKRIYLVRHGESDGNVGNVYQSGDIALSQKGIMQASSVAKRFERTPIERIISSPYTRARATADHIAEMVGMSVEENSSLREITRPSEIVGMAKTDPKAVKIMGQILEHDLEKEYHYSNEENPYDMYARAQKALSLFEGMQEEIIVAVSHRFFLKMLVVAVVTDNEDIGVQAHASARTTLICNNASVSTIELREVKGKSKWHLVSWNDTQHLM